jgi:hypothetical protein
MGDESSGHKVQESGRSGRKICVLERVQRVVDRRTVQIPLWKRRLGLAASGYCIMGFCEHGLELSVRDTGKPTSLCCDRPQ